MMLLAEHQDLFTKLLPTILTVIGAVVVGLLGALAVVMAPIITARLGRGAARKQQEIAQRDARTADWSAFTAPLLARLATVEETNDRLRKDVDKANERIDHLERELTKKDSLIRALVAYVRLLRTQWGAPSIPSIPPELSSDI